MAIALGRDICCSLSSAEQREWLITNGIGGYGCGTVAGLLSRHYHGLLVAALKPPLGRTLLVAKVNETVEYQGKSYQLSCDRWASGTVTGHGYRYLERFYLDHQIPVWRFALGDCLLEKRIWMEQGANTTYLQYHLRRGSNPLQLKVTALGNYRSHHHSTRGDWSMETAAIPDGLKIIAREGAKPFYWRWSGAQWQPLGTWYRNYELAVERYRGIDPHDDHWAIATATVTLQPGETTACSFSTAAADPHQALERHRAYQISLVQHLAPESPAWLVQLHQAANQFIVSRTVDGMPGKTAIAGYPWFGDWGRDTMIALPGLALATGRPEIARPILSTFARYLDQGMLPNLFPEAGETPEYNTVDAILWYFEAVRAYVAATQDHRLLAELFPALEAVIAWHQKGTRYGIHLDKGLIYAGEDGLQLTWMDAKVGDWVVTPRRGKPVEISALWYNALDCMVQFARQLDRPADIYQALAQKTKQGFQRFWQSDRGYCYDVLDGPAGHEPMLRPNQIFAVALARGELLSPAQQKAVVDTVAQQLLTSYGLRSQAPHEPSYAGQYGGGPRQRDGSYHRGTAWGWLIGPFIQAHLRVYQDPVKARSFLEPLIDHLAAGCVGTLGEIFDGDPPHTPRGAFAQAWTVAEVLRAWQLIAAAEAA